jgi:outer membrane cobalamin receptor
MRMFKKLLLVGVLGIASSLTAIAQQQTKEAATEEPLQEIVVTGSRIAAPNAVSTSPIAVISSESIATTGKPISATSSCNCRKTSTTG